MDLSTHLLELLSNYKGEDYIQESLDQSVFLHVYNEKSNPDLMHNYYQAIGHNIRNCESHKDLHQMMTSNNIPYVILKGMASARYYSEPLHRMLGDIDFLVDFSDVDRVEKVLELNGIKRTDRGEHTFHRHYIGNGEIWELHWEAPCIPPNGYVGKKIRVILSDIVTRAEYYDGYMVPSHFHHGIILLLHTAGHLTTSGIGLRQLCDWAVFENSFSEKEFLEMYEVILKEIGLWEFAKVLTAISIKYLGADDRVWTKDVETELVDSLMIDILDSGNFGKKDSQRINQAKLMRNGLTNRVEDSNFALNLFSNLSFKAKARFPLLRRVKILLPLGCLYICVRYLIWIIQGKRKKVMVQDVLLGAKRRQRVYKHLKLFEGDK